MNSHIDSCLCRFKSDTDRRTNHERIEKRNRKSNSTTKKRVLRHLRVSVSQFASARSPFGHPGSIHDQQAQARGLSRNQNLIRARFNSLEIPPCFRDENSLFPNPFKLFLNFARWPIIEIPRDPIDQPMITGPGPKSPRLIKGRLSVPHAPIKRIRKVLLI